MAARKRKATVSFKKGKPNDLELSNLAGRIASKWEPLGIQLGIDQDVLDEIAVNAKDIPHRMLLRWIKTTDSAEPYRDLYNALCEKRVGLDDVAKEYCCVESRSPAKARKTVSKEINKGTKRTRAKTAKVEKKTDGVSHERGATATEPPVEADKEEKKPTVKTGKPNKKELQYIAKDIHLKGNSWKQLARLLGFDDAEITACDKENEELFEKAYQMLLHWQQRKGREATYQVLYDALIDELDSFRHLAEKYCCKN